MTMLTNGRHEARVGIKGSAIAILGSPIFLMLTGALFFPPSYHGQIFIAEHGSWNRRVPIGYQISLVRLKNGKASSYEVFAEGWLDGGVAWG